MIGVAYDGDDSFLFVNLTIDDEVIEKIRFTIMLMLQVEKLEVQRGGGFLQCRDIEDLLYPIIPDCF